MSKAVTGLESRSETPHEVSNNTIDTNVFKPYGICFSKQGDWSSQWNEYADHTRGVSLGFEKHWFVKKGIKEQFPSPNISQIMSVGIGEAIYDIDTLVEELSLFYYCVINLYGVNAWIDNILYTLKCVSGFAKNATFKPEQEVRIVYYPIPGSHEGCIERPVSELKEYGKAHYEIDWRDSESVSLKSIILGHNCPFSREEIYSVLSRNNIKDVKVLSSEYTYRINTNK